MRLLVSTPARARRLALLAATALAGGLSTPALAQEVIDGGASVTVDGPPVWTRDLVYVGDTGQGELTVNSGADIATNATTLGRGAGSNGRMTLSGTGTTWNNVGEITVGDSGQGSLRILDGAVVTSVGGTIAERYGSQGEVVVDGIGSRWQNFGTLIVGGQVNGSLTITNGGYVSSRYTYVGMYVDSASSVYLEGPGSRWTTTGPLYLGFYGDAKLDILDGAVVQSTRALVGTFSTSQSEVVVDGANSAWTVADDLEIGSYGQGSLTVSGGGAVAATWLYVGSFDGGVGDVDLRGTGSTLVATDELGVGYWGRGVISVSDGASLTSGYTILGAGDTGVGEVTITGAGSTWTVSDDLEIGSAGQGSVAIADGAAMTVSGDVYLASFTGSKGSLSLSGAGSTLTMSKGLFVGYGGDGEIRVTGGAALTTGDVTVGAEAGSRGLVELSGDDTTWTIGGDLALAAANGGDGEVRVLDGATVSGANAVVGAGGGAGLIAVSGEGSRLDLSGELLLGRDGEATLTIDQGGGVSARAALIGGLAGGLGQATVSGAGSSLTVAETLIVGGGGEGSLLLADGGRVSADLIRVGEGGGSGRLQIGGREGEAAAAAGTIGADMIVLGADGVLGVNHSGTTLADAFVLNAALSGDGRVDHEAGYARITRAGDFAGLYALTGGVLSLETSGALGTAILRLDGGAVRLADGVTTDNALEIAGDATVEVTSGAATHRGALNGSGDLTKTGAGLLTFAGDVSSFDGLLTVAEGELRFDGRIGGTLELLDGARLTGDVRLNNLTLGGLLNPGGAGVQHVLMVDGDYVQRAGSTYAFDIDASGGSDLIQIAGTATLEGGVAYAAKADGVYLPEMRWTILTAAGGVTGRFASLEQNAPFVDLALIYEGNSVILEAVRNAVPFPDAAESDNQRAVAAAAEALGDESAIYQAVVGSGAPEIARAAFDQLSGETYGSINSLALESALLSQGAVRRRLADRAEGGGWIQALVGEGEVDSGDGAYGVETRTTGWIGGTDVDLGPLTLGFSLSEIRDDFTSSAQLGDGRVVSRSGGVHGRWTAGPFSLTAGAAYGDVKTDVRRRIRLPALTEDLQGDRSGSLTQAFAEAGWALPAAGAVIEPFAAVSTVRMESDAMVERGSAARLSLDASEDELTTSILGLRFASPAVDAWSLHGTIGWRKAYGDIRPETAATFVDGDAPFTVTGAALSRDALLVDFEGRWNLGEAVQVGIGYSGVLGSRSESQSLQARASLAF